MSLLALQRDMRLWLTREDGDAAARLGADAAPGLRVYQNNYRAQLAACLGESFERTRDWIGGEAFHRAVVAHVDRMPPHSWTLDAYGRDFPATLAALYPADPEVTELAWLDMALGEAFVATDAVALTADDLDDIDWDDEVRIALEERAAMSPDALTGLEANLRFAQKENMLTRIFGRLTAWQNWIFQRPNAVGEHGALKVYGKGDKAQFDWNRV